MAYKNIVLQSCADKKEVFARLRDFLCKRNGTYDYSTDGIGWTLHDSSYAVDEDNPQLNDWFVVYSPGESGDEDLYYYIKWANAYISLSIWLYWNNTTHAGVRGSTYYNALPEAESGSYELSVYGDLDFVSMVESVNNASYDYLAFFGKITGSVHDDTVATSSASLSSGSDVVITLDAVPAAWEVGQKIFIRDQANIDIITIKAISGSTITADLTRSYSAGVKLQGDCLYCVSSSYSTLNATFLVGHTSTSVFTTTAYYSSYNTYPDPDALNSNYIAAHIHLAGADVYMGHLPSVYTIAKTGLTEKDVLTDGDTSYRYFKKYTSINLAVKEV